MSLPLCTTPAALLLLFASVSEAMACSISPFPSRRNREATYFVGTAGGDTLHAGPGGEVFYPRDPRVHTPLAAPEQPIYGQVVGVERIAGRGADTVQRAAAGSGGEVVVVPWGYRADCRRIAWFGSARWVRPGAKGMYIAQLRDPRQWVDGRPTFDVMGSFDPYLSGDTVEGAAAPGNEALSPDQFFELYAALPDVDSLDDDPAGALGPLRAWFADHPSLASRDPVPEMVRDVLVTAEYARVARIVPPMLGTYRVMVTSSKNKPKVLFIRTSSVPTPDFGDRQVFAAAAGEDPFRVRAAGAYHLHVHGAPRPEEIVERRIGKP